MSDGFVPVPVSDSDVLVSTRVIDDREAVRHLRGESSGTHQFLFENFDLHNRTFTVTSQCGDADVSYSDAPAWSLDVALPMRGKRKAVQVPRSKRLNHPKRCPRGNGHSIEISIESPTDARQVSTLTPFLYELTCT